MAYTLWTKFMNVNPQNPGWFNRDRFVLSAGHGSMLLYSMLHLSGYDLVHSVYAIGAAPIGMPGCPEFAFSIASIDSVRMVATDFFSIVSIIIPFLIVVPFHHKAMLTFSQLFQLKFEINLLKIVVKHILILVYTKKEYVLPYSFCLMKIIFLLFSF